MLVRGGLLLDPAVTAEIAWALLHFLWQAVFLAALLWITLRVAGPSARTRYLAAGVTLVLMLLAPAITYWTIRGDFDDPGPLELPPRLAMLIEPAPPGSDPAELVAFPPQPQIRGDVSSDYSASAADDAVSLPPAWSFRLQRAVPWIALGWIGFTLALAVYQWVAMLLLHRSLKHNTAPLREGNDRLEQLPARLGIQRRVAFVECSLLRAPATVGWFRPVVLIPSHALDSLWPRQLDALISHELAHICRNDYVVNIVQIVVESVLAFHPAVWWVSARVREEREACCDEQAAEVVGSRKEYASALATMDQLPPNLLPSSTALSAAGGPLLRRVRRIAMSRHLERRHSRFALAAVLGPLVTMGVLLLVVGQLIATSVNVTPPRGLHDLGSLGATVYDAMGLEPPQGGTEEIGSVGIGNELLSQLQRVLDTTDWKQKRFDDRALADLVDVVLRTPHSDVLASVQLPLTDLRIRTSHELHPQWRYGSHYQRHLIRRALLNQSRLLGGDPGHRYARAAILLAAQEASINGTVDLGRMLNEKNIDGLAGLSSRESARLRRVLDDHRVIVRAAQLENTQVRYALRRVWAHREGLQPLDEDESQEMRQHVFDGMSSLLRLSQGRPDLQWNLAKMCWLTRVVLAEDESQLLFTQFSDGLSGKGSSHVDRWLADARAAQPLVAYPAPSERYWSDVDRAVHERAAASARLARPSSD